MVFAKYSLLAPVVVARLSLIVEIAGILDGDLIALLRLVGAIALLQHLSCDTHDDVDICNVQIDFWRLCCWGRVEGGVSAREVCGMLFNNMKRLRVRE